MHKKVIIMNGYGGSGKGEFIQAVKTFCGLKSGIRFTKYSIIEPVKEQARRFGYNGGKTERDRKMLSDFKKVLTEYRDLPRKELAGNFNQFIHYNEAGVYSVDIRMAEDIDWFINYAMSKGIDRKDIYTIFIENDRIKPITSNRDDASVEDYTYDIEICNDGDLIDLHQKAFDFTMKFIFERDVDHLGVYSFAGYQIEAARTIDYDLPIHDLIQHSLFGMCSEVGELNGLYQKKLVGHEFNKEHAKKELGDVLWFIAEYCTAMGWTLGEVARLNIEKLEKRYPDGFDTDKSIHRDKDDV